MMLEKICSLMIGIDRQKPADFAGLGLIIYNEHTHLPIASLKLPDHRISLPVQGEAKVLPVLLKVSKLNHYYHDGFHLLDKHLSLTHLSQYFAAPVQEAANMEFEFGSRYRTAFYGSFLPGVIACCVISNAHGPVIFMNGKKINPYNNL